jgi:UDP-N-acetylmuramyl tripeptide synthase
MIVADIDDSAFPSLNDINFDNLILTTASPEHPTLQTYLQKGGLGAWTSDDRVRVASSHEIRLDVPLEHVPLTLEGNALFQSRNVMLAAAIAVGIGIDPAVVERGLLRVLPDNAHLPTSMNSFVASDVRVIIDRPSPSWFLGPLLRATRALKANRLIFVVDYRDVATHDDTVEVGRMIGRNASMVSLIDDDISLASVVAIKAGIAQNDVPPPIAHAETLQKAVQRAITAAREDDVVVVLTSRAQTVYRALARQRGA